MYDTSLAIWIVNSKLPGQKGQNVNKLDQMQYTEVFVTLQEPPTYIKLELNAQLKTAEVCPLHIPSSLNPWLPKLPEHTA